MYVHAVATTPAEPLGTCRSMPYYRPGLAGFQRRRPSPNFRRVGFRITLFEACSAFTHACGRPVCQVVQDDPLHRRLPQLCYLHHGSDCYRLERPVAGWDSHPLKTHAFARRTELSGLDGCYVLKTDLAKQAAHKETVHARYKDLSMVEWAFRTSKTVQLEIRPIHVRLASRTRGYVFVVLLAYRIVQELAGRWSDIDLTVDEGIKELATLCATEVLIEGQPRCHKIPHARQSARRLLEATKVRLPDVLPCSGVRVATRKKLPENRTTR